MSSPKDYIWLIWTTKGESKSTRWGNDNAWYVKIVSVTILLKMNV